MALCHVALCECHATYIVSVMLPFVSALLPFKYLDRAMSHGLSSLRLHPTHSGSLCLINPYPADHDYCHFFSVLLAYQSLLLGMKYVSKHQDF